MKLSNSHKGFFALMSSSIIFALFGIFIREMDKMFGEQMQLISRNLIATLVAFSLVFFYKASFRIPKDKLLRVGLFSISFPLTGIFVTLSVTQIKVANTIFLLYGGNIIVSFLLGSWLLKEKLNFLRIFSAVLVILGLVIFAHPISTFSFSSGVLFGFLAGIFDAIANYFRKDLQSLPQNTLLTYQYLFGTILSVGLAILLQEDVYKEFHMSSFIIMFVYGILLVVLGNLLIYGFANYDINIGSIVLASQIVFIIILSWVFLRESPTTTELIGGLIIFIATILSTVKYPVLYPKYGS